MRAPFNGDPYVSAGWRYDSGTGHFAYDYVMPIGTPLYAVGDGRIVDCNDGVPNDEDQPGDTDYPNEPSNWICLVVNWHDKPVTLYYQHLSPGLRVKPGDRVREGDLIAHSGDSGNTSGPHLHFAAMHGVHGEAERYIYMENDGDNPYVIFPPDKIWKDDDMALSADDKDWIEKKLAASIHQNVWRHTVQRPDPLADLTFDQTIERWDKQRGTRVIAQASAEATVKALQKAGLVSEAVDSEAIAMKVADEVAARLEA